MLPQTAHTNLPGRPRRFRNAATAATIACVGAIAALIAIPTGAAASTAPNLGSAAGFAVLAGTPAVTNTGPSVISGSLGIAPAAAVTGFPPGSVVNGSIQAATSAAGTAKNDLTAAYGVAALSPCNFDKTGENLGDRTLTPGTYCQTTALTLSGTLTLSGDGVFIFQVGSTLITAPGATVRLTNGAQACNVYWQVSSSATLDTTTTFVGTIMAATNISLNNGVRVTGRVLTQTGQVTLINDSITVPSTCTNTLTSASVPTAVPTTPSTPRTGVAVGAGFSGGALIAIGITMAIWSSLTAISPRRRRDCQSRLFPGP